MRKLLDYIVETFGFIDFSEYTRSLIHRDFSLLFISLSAALSIIASKIEVHLGVKPVLIGAIVLLLLWELGSGLVVSMHKGKESFLSKKFGRFSLKVFFWISMFYIIYSFRSQFDGTNTAAFELFDWLHTAALVYMFLEYLVSVDENMAKITGKQDTFLQIVIKKLKSFIEVEDKVNENEQQ